MPLPFTISCFSKIQIGLPFWYQLTRVVPDKGLAIKRMCVCVRVCCYHHTAGGHGILRQGDTV